METLYNWKKTLHIIRGLPGEGKSTLARSLVNSDAQTTENDDYWYREGEERLGRYTYELSMTHIAAHWCWATTFRKLRQYDEVAVANTFVKRDLIIPYIEQCRKLGILVKLHRPTTSWIGDPQECFKKNIHSVPEQTILDMKKNWEEMTQDAVDAILGIKV